jgi:hypothetical protein
MTQLWAEPEHPNLATALGGYVGSGAPLVAGFALAAVVLLLVSPGVASNVPLVGPAVVAMVVSASLMVLAIRYGFWAVSYWTTPAERLMWNPAAVVRMAPLDRERSRLAARMAHFRRLRRRTEHLFELGLIVFLAAVVLMLIPDRWRADSPSWRWAAAGCAAFALLIHLLWSAGTWLHEHLGRWYKWLTKESELHHDAATAAADKARPGQRKTVRGRLASVVKAADNGLVKGLVVIWPPVRAAVYDEPQLPEAGDLIGLRQ